MEFDLVFIILCSPQRKLHYTHRQQSVPYVINWLRALWTTDDDDDDDDCRSDNFSLIDMLFGALAIWLNQKRTVIARYNNLYKLKFTQLLVACVEG